jgi:hypothetical protein
MFEWVAVNLQQRDNAVGAMKTALIDQLAARLRAKNGRFWQQSLLLRSDPGTFVSQTRRPRPFGATLIPHKAG